MTNTHIVNCLCSKFREELEKEGGHDIESRLEKEFLAWFRSHVSGSIIYAIYHVVFLI